ncbi:uncharacterized protein LOC141854595 [Brevipalpus obovatus]|uniref:uncharacterized protein LOC141854595 n=1 Tax=Brevipalpus obovatus TaxID=246614 RepID=UPI003D9F1B52
MDIFWLKMSQIAGWIQFFPMKKCKIRYLRKRRSSNSSTINKVEKERINTPIVSRINEPSNEVKDVSIDSLDISFTPCPNISSHNLNRSMSVSRSGRYKQKSHRRLALFDNPNLLDDRTRAIEGEKVFSDLQSNGEKCA